MDGVAVYIQNHIPVKHRDNLMLNTVEVICLQINLPHLKPILVGSCYRTPSANSHYLENMCEMLDNVCDINREVYFLGDLNIDWLSGIKTVTSACNLDQVVSQPTRVVTNRTGIKSSTYTDHIFTNAADICFKAISKSIVCSDHNIIAISRKTKVPKAGPNIVYKRSYNTFCRDSYVDYVNNICWSVVCNEEQPDAELETFMKLLIPVTNKHTPIKKMTVKTVKSSWIDEELKHWLRGMRQKVWQLSLASQLIGKRTAN